MLMIHRLIAILLVLCCALSASRAMAWGTLAHSFLTVNTVMQLPDGALKNFVNQYFTTIRPYATNEPPGQHYIDIDVYPEFLAGQMPRNLNVLYAKYGTGYVNSQGISPWTIANYRATLTA